MKRIVFHLAAIASVLLMHIGHAQAETVRPEAAKAKAIEFLSTGARKLPARQGVKRKAPAVKNVELAYTSVKDGKTCFYVYNNGNDGGFVIVGGDDAAKEILAYVPEGHFDYDKAPDNVKWWLGQYEEGIMSLSTTKENLRKKQGLGSNPTFYDIPDLISTKWNQGYPYNKTIQELTGHDFATGCVTTAIAQIMKYWNYPTSGTGSHENNSVDPPLSADFESTTYDWEKMLDSYEGDFSETESEAVSKLMCHIGIADDISFGYYSAFFTILTDGSLVDKNGSEALVNYFGYDKNMESLCRSDYTLQEWKALIFDELAVGRPVYYSGDVKSGDSYVGHAFVCHGYSATLDMFSINWGWGGSMDGYYAIDENDGMIGSGSYDGQISQTITIGIQPPKTAEQTTVQHGDTLSINGVRYKIMSPTLKTAAVISNNTYESDLTILDSIYYSGDTYIVNRIDNNAFNGSAFSSIHLPKKLLSIGYEGLSFCPYLEEIVIPEGTEKIGCRAFLSCYSLKKITLPSTVSILGDRFTEGCLNLLEVNIPKNVKRLGHPFDDCFNLFVITCESDTPPEIAEYGWTTKLQEDNFVYMQKKGALFVPQKAIESYKNAKVWKDFGTILPLETKSNYSFGEVFEVDGLRYLTIPNGVEMVGTGDNWASKELVVPSQVTYQGVDYDVLCIGSGRPINGDFSSLVVSNGIIDINYQAFYNRQQLQEIYLPNSLERIADYAFSWTGLKELQLPINMDQIRYRAFAGCQELSKVVIPKCNTIWGSFAECTSLKEVYVGDVFGLQAAFSSCDSIRKMVLNHVDAFVQNSEPWPMLKEMTCLQTVSTEDDLPTNYVAYFENGSEVVYEDYPFSEYQSDGTLYVPEASISTYQASDNWKYWGNIVPIVPLTNIALDKNSCNLQERQQTSMKIAVTPTNAAVQHVIWSSSDHMVVSVNQDGVVTAQKAGTATIYARSMYYSDLIDSCIVTVTPKSHKIAYVLDGETYQTDSITVGEAITLPEEPVKTGYVFTGWEGLPNDSIMPDQDLELTAIFKKLGDPNDDGLINITDIVSVISYILEEAPADFSFKVADVNGDGIINITDIVAIIDIILSDEAPASAQRIRRPAFGSAPAGLTSLEIVPFGIDAGTTSATVTLDLLNPNDEFTAFECDIVLPDGIDWAYTIDRRGNIIYTQPTFNAEADRTDANYHTLSNIKKMEDGSFKVMCYSMAKETFQDEEGAILNLPLTFSPELAEGIYEIEVANTVLTRTDVSDKKIGSYRASVVVGTPDAKTAVIYGDVNATAVAMINERLAGCGTLDLRGALAVDGSTAFTLNDNAVIFVADGMSIKNAKNVVVDGTCAVLTLADGVAFTPSESFTAESATYGRTLGKDEYGTLVLPFEPNAATKAVYAFYELSEADGSTLTFDETTAPEAGTPYVIVSKDDAATFAGSGAIAVTAGDATADGWTMKGTYETLVLTDATELASLYCLSGNQFKQAKSKLTMNPFRAYFQGSGTVGSITLRGNDGTTRILSETLEPVGDCYDLMGRRVLNAEKGVYIVNGKKVLK